jgi:hypothetical protein
MFARKSKQEIDPLTHAIEKLFEELDEFSGTDDEYKILSDRMTELYAIRERIPTDRVSKETLALIAGNLAGIMIIVLFERNNVITTKAKDFVLKLR